MIQLLVGQSLPKQLVTLCNIYDGAYKIQYEKIKQFRICCFLQLHPGEDVG